ncbi:MAG: rhodanese-like domain-containing protein, partial [Sneathiella sp.]
MSYSLLSPIDLRQIMMSKAEYALIDVREQGVHSEGHPFFAVSLPLSRFELDVERLLPSKSAPIYLLDQGPETELAVRAAKLLEERNYVNIAIVEGGVFAWREAGLELFSGVNVPSKAFGEFVEEAYETPHITAEELAKRQEKGEKIAILDSRPFPEFYRMSIPGGIDMPGAELVHRVFETVVDDKTQIVVNCAGRTRSIIGAQSLINAGLSNPVCALKDGTMGWYLADFELAHRQDALAPPPALPAAVRSQKAALAVADRFDVKFTTLESVKAWQRDDQTTLYVLDVRTEEEYLDGHLPGSYHAPGGQLVQATDEFVAVRNAKIVVVDDDATRAIMTASWLTQMDWQQVYVLQGVLDAECESGPQPRPSIPLHPHISVLELDAVLTSREATAVIDLASSLSYRKGHVPGSYWAIRSRLSTDHIFIPPVGLIILTSDDSRLAHLAAPEIARLRPDAIVRVLEGGTDAWEEMGQKLESGDTNLLSTADDVWYKPYDTNNSEEIRQRMQDYLTWEVGLLQQVERDGLVRFRHY